MSGKKTILILDSHALIHRAYHALPEFYNNKGFPTGALYGVVSTVISVLKEFNPDYVFAAFDLPKPTYRHELYKDYKATRPKAKDDLVLQIQKVKEIFKAFGFEIYEKEGYEADDVIATLANILKNSKEFKDYRIIIVSGDMDTLQLVDDRKVMVYTFKRSLKDTILYDEKAVKERFGFAPEYVPDFKGLKGDPSDNIPGVKGIGDKTATELIKEFKTIENIYKAIKDSDPRLEKFKPRVIKLLKDGQEEAFFSKMLATTKDDLDLEFRLSKKTWKDKLDLEKLKKLFDELEFRSLKPRLFDLLDIYQDKAEQVDTDEILFKRDAVMVYLLDSNKTEPTPEDVFTYSGARSLIGAYQKLKEKIQTAELDFVYEQIENPLIPVIDKMNQTGIMIDVEFFKSLEKEFSEKLRELEQKAYKLAGEKFNLRSPKQLSEILYNKLGIKQSKKTSTGQLKTDEKTLKSIQDKHPLVKLILEYREIHKLYSTYVEAILKQVDKNGRIHTTFVQTGTTTGRLSSKNPNLQNIPIRTAEGKRIRQGFIAPKGKALLSLDYSQIELRIAAILSKDKELIKIFKEGRDIHTAVAAKIFGVSESEVTQDMRRHAKVINFGILYGMGPKALKENLGESFSLEDAKEYIQKYFKTFSGLADWIEETLSAARQLGYTKTLFGRKRYFYELNSKIDYIRKAAERMAVNAPIQGTQADMIKQAMWKIDEKIIDENLQKSARIILQIHDEIILEVDKQHLCQVAEFARNIMENVLPEKYKLVPIIAEPKAGDSWARLEKIIC